MGRITWLGVELTPSAKRLRRLDTEKLEGVEE